MDSVFFARLSCGKNKYKLEQGMKENWKKIFQLHMKIIGWKTNNEG